MTMRSPSTSPKPQSLLKRMFSSSSSSSSSSSGQPNPTALFHLEQQGFSRADAADALVQAKSRSKDLNYVISLIHHKEHTQRRKDLAAVVKVGDRVPVSDMWEPTCTHCQAEQRAFASKEAKNLAKWEAQAATPPSKITRFSSHEELAAHYLQVSGDYAERARQARKTCSGGAGDEQLAQHYLQVARDHAERARSESAPAAGHQGNRGIGFPRQTNAEWAGHAHNNKGAMDMAAHNSAVLMGMKQQGRVAMKAVPDANTRQLEFLY